MHKSSRFSQVFLEESLEFLPAWRHGSIPLNPVFVLLPAKKNPILEKKSCKRYALMALGPSCLKMVFALLTEVIAFYVQILIVQVRVLCFEGPVKSIFLRFSGL